MLNYSWVLKQTLPMKVGYVWIINQASADVGFQLNWWQVFFQMSNPIWNYGHFMRMYVFFVWRLSVCVVKKQKVWFGIWKDKKNKRDITKSNPYLVVCRSGSSSLTLDDLEQAKQGQVWFILGQDITKKFWSYRLNREVEKVGMANISMLLPRQCDKHDHEVTISSTWKLLQISKKIKIQYFLLKEQRIDIARDSNQMLDNTLFFTISIWKSFYSEYRGNIIKKRFKNSRWWLQRYHWKTYLFFMCIPDETSVPPLWHSSWIFWSYHLIGMSKVLKLGYHQQIFPSTGLALFNLWKVYLITHSSEREVP